MPDFGTEILGLIGSVAPTIATALGGPLAGMADRAICGALGLATDAKPAEITTALAAATPDQMLALKNADNAFAAQMKQLDVDLARVDAGDRASARAREVSVHDSTPAVLAYGLTVGFFGLVWLMVFHSVPVENASAVNILLGTLGTAWIAAMSYYFGSTSGSRTKDAMLFQSSPAGGDPPTPAPPPAGRSPSPGTGTGRQSDVAR
jgi:hypothetical protein